MHDASYYRLTYDRTGPAAAGHLPVPSLFSVYNLVWSAPQGWPVTTPRQLGYLQGGIRPTNSRGFVTT